MSLPDTLLRHVTCKLCKAVCNDARTLSCQHSFCRSCLKGLPTPNRDTLLYVLKRKETLPEKIQGEAMIITCPQCNTLTPLDKRGVDGLPVNQTLNSLTARKLTTNTPYIPCSLCELTPRPAVRTCRDCSGTHYCHECLQMYHPSKGTFKQHVLLSTTRPERNEANRNRFRIWVINHLTYKPTAQVVIQWVEDDFPANLYAVRCSLERVEEGQVYHEEIQTLVRGNRVIMSGLRFHEEYKASVTALLDELDEYIVTSFRKAEITFRTGGRLKCTPFAWDPADCKETIALSKTRTKVALERHRRKEIRWPCVEFNPSWSYVDGVCSDTLFSSGQHYWETVVNYMVLKRLNNYDRICSIGIMRQGREDSYRPICRNWHCLCLVLMKEQGFPNIVMAYWNGIKKVRTNGRVVHPIKGRVLRSVRLGYYLDMDKRYLKIVDAENDVHVHTFTGFTWPHVSVICELNNAEKFRCSVDLISEGFENLPSAVFE